MKICESYGSSINTVLMDRISVRNWVNGEIPLRNLIPEDNLSGPDIIFDKSVLFLNLSEKIDAHNVSLIERNPDGGYYNAATDYLKNAIKLLTGASEIGRQHPLFYYSLNYEQVKYVSDNLPNVPPSSRPIYFVTVGEGIRRKIVYIGKSINTYQRFKGGHAALVKLLNPIYDGLKKDIFLGEIYYGVKENFDMVNIDSIISAPNRVQVINMVEALMINFFKPELNIEYTSQIAPRFVKPVELSIFNSSGEEVNIPVGTITDDMLGCD